MDFYSRTIHDSQQRISEKQITRYYYQNTSPLFDYTLLVDCLNRVFDFTSDHDQVTEQEFINAYFNNEYQLPKEPALCPALSAEIFENLHVMELEKRPVNNYMDKVQKQLINPFERAKCVAFLERVANQYNFVLEQESLHLAISYLDRYLSKKLVLKSELKFVGLICLMIAIKYQDEVCLPKLTDYLCLTQNKYSANEFIQMEYSILTDLEFDVTTPTAWCFLGRYLTVAGDQFRGMFVDLENTAKYITWLSLFSYHMIRFRPSMVAASSVFLARYVLVPWRKPWSSTLVQYTKYQPADLHDCVLSLYALCCNSRNAVLPTIKEKYERLVFEYGCLGFEKQLPATPEEYFKDQY